MPDVVYQVMALLSALVAPLPIGTNLGLLHLLWLLVSGRRLAHGAPGRGHRARSGDDVNRGGGRRAG